MSGFLDRLPRLASDVLSVILALVVAYWRDILLVMLLLTMMATKPTLGILFTVTAVVGWVTCRTAPGQRR